jgi:Amt family ammonium transporter
VGFQLTFAAITPAIIIGAFAERMKFSAVLLFLTIWFTFAYLPMAHMVWFWAGPDAYTLAPENLAAVTAAVGADAARAFLARLASAPDEAARALVLADYGRAVASQDGFLFAHGLLDFAGGTVVEVNSGVAGLVCALMVGPRVGYGREPMAPHNLSLALIGTGLLFVGWLGFNAGSALEANGLAAMTLFNTMLAAAAGTLAWSVMEWKTHQHPSFLGAASGLVAGLVAITPACGYVGPFGAIVIGAAAGLVSLWAVVSLKARFRYDDSLDVFGVHGMSGIIGTILTGLFAAPALGGVGLTSYLATSPVTSPQPYHVVAQLLTQTGAVMLAAILSAVVSYAALKLCQRTVGLRLVESDEREGLDVASHGERAYNG